MQRRTDSRRSLASSVSPASKAERCCPSHSPTLRPWITDRRMRYPGWTTSYVEELWSPSLAHIAGNRQAKAGANTSIHFFLRAGGVFLPQAGPRSGLVLLQAGHHLASCRSVTSRNDEGDPLGRPRLARNAARNLACTPSSEGMGNIELEPGVAVRPGRDRRGWGRSGGVDRGVGQVCHEVLMDPPQRRIEHRDGLRKGFNEKNCELIPCPSPKCPRKAESTMLRAAGH